jgi:carbon storage regulator CsrA
MIGDSITVTVSEIRGGQVLLTVQAPAEVRVDRREIHERRVREVAGGASGCK